MGVGGSVAVLDCVLARQYTIVASVVSCINLAAGL